MENKTYKTRNFTIASTLAALGYQLENVDRTDPKRCFFIFEEIPEIEKILKQFWDGELKVDARTLFDNSKMLKARIHFE